MKLVIDNDFRQKIMKMAFEKPFHISEKGDVNLWKQAWLKELASWHSPYKLMLDCENLSITDYPNAERDLNLLFQFFQGFFLRKAVAFHTSEEKQHYLLPIDRVLTYEDACQNIGIRVAKATPQAQDFRGAIQIHNDFRNHVMELSFLHPLIFDDAAKIATLRSKIMNNLMQWHSKWNLLIDCTNLTVHEEWQEPFEKMLSYFHGFFMTTVIGFSPQSQELKYPFPTFRSRHKAVLQLEKIGAHQGNEAHCNSKKPAP